MSSRSFRARRAVSPVPAPAATTRVHPVVGKADEEDEIPTGFGSGTLRPDDLWFRARSHGAREPVDESYYTEGIPVPLPGMHIATGPTPTGFGTGVTPGPVP